MRTASVCVIAIIMLLSVGERAAGRQPESSFRGLGLGSVAYAASADGRAIVGRRSGQACRWMDGNITFLGFPPAPYNDESEAFAVSADGSVVVGIGWDYDQKQYPVWGFCWSEAEGMVMIGPEPVDGPLDGTWATGVSGDGITVTGYSDTIAPGFIAYRWNRIDRVMTRMPAPFYWSQGVSADGIVFVGITNVPFAFGAASWSEATGTMYLGDLPGGEMGGAASAANSDGSVIVGRSRSAASGQMRSEAFRWTKQTGMVGLGDLPGDPFRSYALGVSGDGNVVVGRGYVGAQEFRAFVWDTVHGMRSLRDVLVDDYGLDMGDWILREATGISADGRTIVGWGWDGHSQFGEGWAAYLDRPLVPCPADFNADGVVNSQDFFDYLAAFFAAPGDCPPPCPGEIVCAADFNGDCTVNSQDFFDFLVAFFAGCG